MRRHLPFLLAAAVPFLMLCGMTADQLRVVRFGTPITVPVIPVDPMSLFSGEYARLSFEFTAMNAERLETLGVRPPEPVAPALTGTQASSDPDTRFGKGDRVWVVLAQGADHLWHPVRLERSPPGNGGGGEVAVRAEVRGYHSFYNVVHDNATRRPTGERKWSAMLSLHTGLESFFVPQGEAVRIERAERGREVTAEIAVLAGGRAAVRRLFIKGQEVRY